MMGNTVQTELSDMRAKMDLLFRTVSGLQAAIDFRAFQTDLAEVVEKHGGSPQGRITKGITCDNCGHGFRECPTIGRGKEQPPTQRFMQEGFRANGLNRRGEVDVPTFVKVRYKGGEWIGRLDSGADLTVFPRGMIEEKFIVSSDESLTASNGTNVKISGAAKVKLQIGELLLSTAGVVSPNVDQLILGLDWLCLHSVEWKHGADFIYIKGTKVALYSGVELRHAATERHQGDKEAIAEHRQCYNCGARGI